MDEVFKVLNNMVEKTLSEYDDLKVEDLKFLRGLNHIIISNPFRMKTEKYFIHKSFDVNYKSAHNFLRVIKPQYADHLNKTMEAGIISLPLAKKMKNPAIAVSGFDFDTGKREILIPLCNKIEDSYTLTHEVFHDYNMDPQNLTLTRDLFTETISMCAELLQEDYFRKLPNSPFEYQKNRVNTMNAFLYKSISVDYQLDVVEKYLATGSIDKNKFTDIMKKKSKQEVKLGDYIFDELFAKEELDYDIQQRYIIGALFSSFIHQKILEDPKKISNFIEINDNLNKMELEDVFKLLNLEIELQDEYIVVSQSSLNELGNAYLKEYKRK